MLGKLVVAEIAWPHPSGYHQIIERYFFVSKYGAQSFERAGAQIHAGNFGHHYEKVLLLVSELPNWRGDFRRRENGGRCLVEQRLEDVMISPVDQNDFGIASSQRPSGCQPSEPPAHNHDARRLGFVRLHVGSFFTWAGYFQ
jgi:hypothetical protein